MANPEFPADAVERFRAHYRPELDKHDRLTLRPEGRKRFPVSWDREPIFLAFGAAAANVAEARAAGFLETCGRELYRLVLGDRFDEVRKGREVDDRTAAYFGAIEGRIGYLGRKDGYKLETLASPRKLDVGYSAEGLCPVVAEIGPVADGKWVAQYSVRTAIDDYNCVRLYFAREPNDADVGTVMDVEAARSYLAWDRRYKATFECWECGREVHWLDIAEAGLREKLAHFKGTYCGC